MPFFILLVSTICAQFAVSPVLLGLNPGLQPYSLAVNLIILPLQPSIMFIGGAAVLLHFFFPPLGALTARFAWVLVAFCNQVALHFSKLRFAELKLPVFTSRIALVLVLAVMILATVRTINELSNPPIPE
jgi:hypothetical protein